MKAFLVSVFSAILIGTASVLWAFHADIESMKTWRQDHTQEDTKLFNVIQGQLANLKEGQKSILEHILRSK